MAPTTATSTRQARVRRWLPSWGRIITLFLLRAGHIRLADEDHEPLLAVFQLDDGARVLARALSPAEQLARGARLEHLPARRRPRDLPRDLDQHVAADDHALADARSDRNLCCIHARSIASGTDTATTVRSLLSKARSETSLRSPLMQILRTVSAALAIAALAACTPGDGTLTDEIGRA